MFEGVLCDKCVNFHVFYCIEVSISFFFPTRYYLIQELTLMLQMEVAKIFYLLPWKMLLMIVQLS